MVWCRTGGVLTMKKIFSLLTVVFGVVILLTKVCDAMTFSQPKEIGRIELMPNGFKEIHNATYCTGEAKMQNGKKVYVIKHNDSGTARFGSGEDMLNFYQIPYKPLSYGGDNRGNTVTLEFGLLGDTIYQLLGDNGFSVYVVKHNESGAYFVNYDCIGKDKNGKFVRYFNTNDAKKQYLGNDGRNVIFKNISSQEGVIIFAFECYSGGQIVKRGEFRFKWDDAAQWFGVEQVVY